ncbi:HEAT repeat domain-containing protein [Paludisphaera mucosa]|uniref:HEAT repeat domain-containing protein n=1 Tax=Paludisphaera mucosa TaxID=3030827 RepID=A0ABT6FCV7_9BACT|nr:HEAT repeat domain-containing protein [Paludisphaera mucosa]MDG3005336.1 HEAT repeat domain-containing protein [Paludisphaera mucosa]
MKLILIASVLGIVAAAAGRRDDDRDELIEALTAEKFAGLPDGALADRDALVRRLAAIVREPPGETEDLRRFLRRRAVIVLGSHGGEKALPQLRRLVEDRDEPFRRDAVIGLGRSGTKEGVAIAAAFLGDGDELYREAAIDGLGESGRAEALDALKAFDASKERPFIARKLREAIEKLEAPARPRTD